MDNGDTDGQRGGETAPAVATLERIADPVVALTDGSITYANRSAKDYFDLTDSGAADPAAIFESWPLLGEAIEETPVGTARQFELESDRYDARVHRGTDGATVLFVPTESTESPTDDRVVKDRAINEAPVGITISDPGREDNPLVYCNEAYEELTGYSTDEVIGRNCRFLQGADSSEGAIAEMAAAIDEERPVTVEVENYRKDGSKFWNEVTIAPVYDDSGTLTNYVGFQNDVTARKEAEIALERRTEELEYVLDRVEGLVQDVTAAVAGSTDRSALEQAVCDRIAREPAYEGVWIGERNPATRAIDSRASAGTTPESIDEDGDHPTATALRTGTTAIETDGGSTRAAASLTYDDIEYGVLTVRTADDRDVDDREALLLSALARTVASGINARETSRILATDSVVAVDVDVTDPTVALVALSTEADCRLEYRRSIHRTDDQTTSLVTATGPDANTETLTAIADDLPGMECHGVVDRDGECLLEVSDENDPVAWLSKRGGRVRSIESEDGTARLTLEIPRSADVRAVVEALEDRYTDTDVVSFEQRDRDTDTRQEFAARLEERLTDRQFTALQRAYLGGYFEWPRPATGEELAQTMDVSRPTFHEHLRTAEAKLCAAFFDPDTDLE